MKTEALKALGLTDEQIAEIMKENGKDVENVKAKLADYEAVKAQLAEAGKTIAEFKAMDVDGVKKAAEEWKQKAEQAERDSAAKLAELEFSSLLDSAIMAAKGRNGKAVRAVLDIDALKASRNQNGDIQSALEALKKEQGCLFESAEAPPPYAAGAGSGPIPGRYDRESFGRMGYRERVALKQEHPEIYETLKKE